jgi:hypothetical protein
MDNNHLKTGALFVAPGQIMYPGITALPRHPNHVSRLHADIGLDLLEAEPEQALTAHSRWSFDHLREHIGQFFYRRGPAST